MTSSKSLFCIQTNPTLAQITPDDTLGSDRSQVNPTNATKDRITGGATRGSAGIRNAQARLRYHLYFLCCQDAIDSS
jgi:hypothetical protein